MKKLIVIIMLVLGSISAFAQLSSATLVASGLTCSMCSKAIYKALQKVSFVDSVDVNIEKSSYGITFRQGSNVQLDELKKAVQDAGFFVASLKVTVVFDNVDVFNDAHVSLGGSTFHFVNVTKQMLTGEKSITLIDKNYVPAKTHKKYSKFTKMKCFETGMMEACCPKETAKTNRVYHVTI